MNHVNHLLRRRSRRSNHQHNHLSSSFVTREPEDDVISSFVREIISRSVTGVFGGSEGVNAPASRRDMKWTLGLVERNESGSGSGGVLNKRLTPAEIAAIQQAQQEQAAQRGGQQQGGGGGGGAQNDAATQRQAASPATKGTTIAGQQHGQTPGAGGNQAAGNGKQTSTYSFFDKFGHTTASSKATTKQATTSSAKATTTAKSSTTTKSSTTSAPKSSTTTTSQTVRMITQSPSSSKTSSAAPTASAINNAADKSGSSTSKMSTGAIVGIVAGVLLGLLLLGAIAGWIYRKWAGRKYSVNNSSWNKIDDDISPFPPNEKLMERPREMDDIYGPTSGPIIGSRRALANARPDSDYSYMQQGNRAGYGAGHSVDVAYPAPSPAYGAVDAYGRPYNPHQAMQASRAQGQVPMNHMYSDQFESDSPHALSPPGSASSRQLLGPSGQGQQPYSPGVVPMPLGRPAVPTSERDFENLQQFSDVPSSHGHGASPFGDEREIDYSPHTATSAGGWVGDAQQPGYGSGMPVPVPVPVPSRPTRPGDELRRHTPPSQDVTSPSGSNSRSLPPSPPQGAHGVIDDYSQPRPLPETPPQIAIPPKSSLPDFQPMSPIRMSTFELRRDSRPLPTPSTAATSGTGGTMPMYEDESAQQKRMYGEVADAAGVLEPPTPKLGAAAGIGAGAGAGAGDESLNSSRMSGPADTTASSFSAHEMSMTPQRLPSLHLEPPGPYVHGQPLSPLTEVETPRSGMSKVTTNNNVPAHVAEPSSPSPKSASHSGPSAEPNPFERTLVAARQNIQPAPGSGSGPVSADPSASSSMNSLAPPFGASSEGFFDPSFPSPAFPPPSPGGMSVPGSVTDSPRRWSGNGNGNGNGNAASRGVSMFYGEDAYGGI